MLYCIQTLRFHPIKFHAGKNGLQSSIFKYQRICFYGIFFKTDEYERADSISFMVLLERKNQLFHIHRSCKIFPCKKITGLSVVGFNWKLTKLYLNFIFFFQEKTIWQCFENCNVLFLALERNGDGIFKCSLLLKNRYSSDSQNL